MSTPHVSLRSRLALGLALAALPGIASAQCITERISVAPGGAEGDLISGFNSPNVNRNYLSADGRFVAFWSDATNLVPNDTNGVADVFVRDRQTGVTTRVSVDSNGVEGDGLSSDPAISADGRFIAFQSAATNLVPNDTNARTDIFVHDMQTGATLRASVDTSGAEGNHDSTRADISADGRFVVFQSKASNLIANDTNGVQDVFVRDMVFLVTNCLSVDDAGTLGTGVSGAPAISATGRWVAFQSAAPNLVPLDLNGQYDVFVRDRGNFTTTLVSTNSIGEQGDLFSQTPSISADGRYVAFSSNATNLIPTDTNNVFDVFVKDRATGITRRASTDSSGFQGNSSSQGGSISADGRFVGFMSQATNLVLNDTNGGPFNLNADVFVKDMVNGATNRLSVDSALTETDTGSSFNVCIARDGSTVAFYSPATNLVPGDTNGVSDVFVRSCGTTPGPASFCSGDGTGTACPCNNNGVAGHGCANSFDASGGFLSGSGGASVGQDTLTLHVLHLPTSASVLFFQGDAQVAAGAGAVFGDGLRCAGGAVLRIGAKICANGGADIGAAVPGDTLVSIKGAIPPGTVTLRHYQAWYRNLATFCTSDAYNLTNGITVTWIP